MGGRDDTGDQEEPGNELADRERIAEPLLKANEVEEEKAQNALPGKEPVETVRIGNLQRSSRDIAKHSREANEQDDSEHVHVTAHHEADGCPQRGRQGSRGGGLMTRLL